MAFALNQYSPCLFENLDCLEDAATQLRLVGGLNKIKPALDAVGRKHSCSRQYGVHLLHRHVFLADDEVMITMYDTRTTFPMRVADISETSLGRLHASVWGLRPGTGNFVPLEFAVEDVPPAQRFRDLDSAFAKDVAAIFVEYQLEHVLGLALVSEDLEPGLETAQGRANIVTPLDLYATPTTSIVEVLWPFPRFEDDDSDGSQEEQLHGNKSNSGEEWRCVRWCQRDAAPSRRRQLMPASASSSSSAAPRLTIVPDSFVRI